MRRKDRQVSGMEEIKTIIDKCKVCHIAMTDKGLPYVVPLNFGYTLVDKTLTLYFHSAREGRKIDILHENKSVCFEMTFEGRLHQVENPCSSGYFFESVIGFGEAAFVDDVDEKCRALALLMTHQTNQKFSFTQQQADSVCVFRVVSADFTGKKKPDPNK